MSITIIKKRQSQIYIIHIVAKPVTEKISFYQDHSLEEGRCHTNAYCRWPGVKGEEIVWGGISLVSRVKWSDIAFNVRCRTGHKQNAKMAKNNTFQIGLTDKTRLRLKMYVLLMALLALCDQQHKSEAISVLWKSEKNILKYELWKFV